MNQTVQVPEISKSEIPPAGRRLIELMQRMNFGRIENLSIQNGEPDFSLPPRVIRKIKIKGENGPRIESRLSDFVLKKEIMDMLAHFSAIKKATITRIDVQYGLPFSMEIEESARS